MRWNVDTGTTNNAALDGSVVMYKINGLEPEIAYDVRVICVESHSCIQRSSAVERFTTPGELLLHVNVGVVIGYCTFNRNHGIDDGVTAARAGDTVRICSYLSCFF